MTIYAGSGYVGFIDHAFTGTLSTVIAAPDPATGKLILTGWSLRGTGAATAPVFNGTVSNNNFAASPLAISATWISPFGTRLVLTAGDGLNITGGAASGVLNGYISYHYQGGVAGGIGSIASGPTDLPEG